MIIDTSYFTADLEIAQLSYAPVASKLNSFINQYEPKFLTELLGYALYKNFQAGIIVTPTPDAKWTDLLYGTEYTNRFGQLDKWGGLIRSLDGSLISIYNENQIDIVVGRGEDFDPTNGSTTTLIPTSLVGSIFVFQQRGFGPYRSDEFTISDDGLTLTLLNGNIFSQDDTYFYYGNSSTVTGDNSTLRRSPIANFIYYWYLRANATITAGAGEASTNVSAPTSPFDKMSRAWNQMANWNRELIEFLYANNTVYDFDTSLFYFNGYGGYWSYRSAANRNQYNLLATINPAGF